MYLDKQISQTSSLYLCSQFLRAARVNAVVSIGVAALETDGAQILEQDVAVFEA